MLIFVLGSFQSWKMPTKQALGHRTCPGKSDLPSSIRDNLGLKYRLLIILAHGVFLWPVLQGVVTCVCVKEVASGSHMKMAGEPM